MALLQQKVDFKIFLKKSFTYPSKYVIIKAKTLLLYFSPRAKV